VGGCSSRNLFWYSGAPLVPDQLCLFGLIFDAFRVGLYGGERKWYVGSSQ